MVEVEKSAAMARQLLFQMAFAVQPLCAENRGDWVWSLGPHPTTIPAKRLAGTKLQDQSDAIAAHFNVEPGTSLFLAEIDQTPWGYAGLKKEESFEFVLKGEEIIRRLGIRPIADAAAAAPEDQQNRSNPLTEIPIIRKGERTTLVVRRVPTCIAALDVVDSKYRYADSDGRILIVTVPLLNSLTRDELVVVLSHEISHIALKLSHRRSTGKAIGKLIFGALVEIGENQESGLSEPNAIDLIKADRLAMRIAASFGVDVPTYVGLLHKLVEVQDTFGAPTYRRTRGINREREEQLKRSADLWTSERKFLSVTGVELPVLQDVSRRARQAHTNPESVFGAAAERPVPADTIQQPTGEAHAAIVPASTQFAPVTDVDAVPRLSAKSKALYQEWLTKPFPRAVAISDKGAMARGYGDNAKQQAVQNCERLFGNPCRLYAVDDVVVWVRE